MPLGNRFRRKTGHIRLKVITEHGDIHNMPARLVLALRYIAIFALVVAIALIMVRWKLPRTQTHSEGILSQLREAWRAWRRKRADDHERSRNQKTLKDRLVLLIDPDEKSARVLVWKLGSLKANVFRSRTGTRGLEHIRSQNPDVVVVDALLTDMSALDFYNALDRRDLPVVFVGVLDAQWDELRKLGRNVVCLPKPYDPEELASLAGHMLRREQNETGRRV